MPNSPSNSLPFPEVNQKKDSDHRYNWVLALFFFMIAAPVASMSGSNATSLNLPTAWFVHGSAACMVALLVISSFISSPKIASTIFFAGLACVGYGPLLVAIGSTQLMLSRSLTHQESTEFRQRFPIPMVLSSGSGSPSLRVRRQDRSEEISAYLQQLGALLKPANDLRK